MKTSTAPASKPTIWKCRDGRLLPILKMTDVEIVIAMDLLTSLAKSGSGWKKQMTDMFNALRDEQIRRKGGVA
jgi:hypothetical protein